MMEFKVTNKVIGSLSINYDELRLQLEESLRKYKGLVVTEESVNEGKRIRALLNNAKKAIDERRKELKAEFLRPYEIVECQSKELISMINQVNQEIDYQLKEFEEIEKNKKRDLIKEIWEDFDFNLITLDQIWNEKWLNKTFKICDIEEEIENNINGIKSSLYVIEGLANDENIVKNLKAKYLINLDLSKTLADFNLEQQKRNVIKEIEVREESNIDEILLSQNNVENEDLIEKEQVYSLKFEVKATKKQIDKLATFLKFNGYDYKKI